MISVRLPNGPRDSRLAKVIRRVPPVPVPLGTVPTSCWQGKAKPAGPNGLARKIGCSRNEADPRDDDLVVERVKDVQVATSVDTFRGRDRIPLTYRAVRASFESSLFRTNRPSPQKTFLQFLESVFGPVPLGFSLWFIQSDTVSMQLDTISNRTATAAHPGVALPDGAGSK
jgi:hypothetical protein